tara:strand:+ start:217 stop:1173 length:957 start_codon:yes stop_codon:yes gene_type:complete
MERLANPYSKDKQTPIQMLLNRLKQQQVSSEQETVKEQVDKQYIMLRQGSRDTMERRLHSNKTSSETTNNTIDKTQPVSQPTKKQDFMKLKSQKDFMDEATDQFNKDKHNSRIKCQMGDIIACGRSPVENPDMDKQQILEIANKLTSEYNTKANDFNKNLKSQAKSNPLLKPTTSDYLINPDTGVIVKNPIVQKLQEQEKLKEKNTELVNSDAYKLAQEYKENREKMRQVKSNLISYGGMKITKIQYDYFEKLRKTNPKQFYIDLQRLKTKQTTGQDLVIKPQQLDKKPKIVNTGGVSVIDTDGHQIMPTMDGHTYII